jgi:hypothetical protein
MAKAESGRGLFGFTGRTSAAASEIAPESPKASSPPPHARGPNAKAFAAALTCGAEPAPPLLQRLDQGGRAPTLAQVRAPWFAYWARELRTVARPSRLLWEQIAVLQALYEAGVLRSGARLLGLGVGDEPLASYFASIGLNVIASDLDGEAEAERVFKATFLPRETFDALVEVSNVDMRRLDDPTLRGLDACWSRGVLNEMNSIYEAEEAVVNAMDVLRPGGVAVHIADMALMGAPEAAPGNLLFSMDFFRSVSEALEGRGHIVPSLDLCLGRDPLDAVIHAPESDLELTVLASAFENCEPPDLKFERDGVAATAFAIIARKRSDPVSLRS